MNFRQKVWKGAEITFSGLVVLGALVLWIYCIELCREMMREYEIRDPAAVQRTE